MLLSTPILEIMKREPISVEVYQSILDAIRLLSDGGFHHLPVVDDKRLVGILSTVDILKLNGDALTGHDAEQPALLATRACVGDIMFRGVIPLSERATVGDAAQLLSSGEYHSVPVIAADGRLIGIVTTTDLIAYMLDNPTTPELPENVRTRLEVLEKVHEAAQSYLESGMTTISQDHLEQVIHEARWAA